MLNASRGPNFLPRVYVDVICHNFHTCFKQLQTTFCLSYRQSVARFCYALLGGSILPVTKANFPFSWGKSPFAVTAWWLPRKFLPGVAFSQLQMQTFLFPGENHLLLSLPGDFPANSSLDWRSLQPRLMFTVRLPGIWLWAGLPPKSLCRCDLSQFPLTL